MRALPAGERRLANVEMLLQHAAGFERMSYQGLFSFIRYMEQLQKYEVDYGEADVTGEHENVVRIMSIHKSKGLEFPIVFVSGLGRRFNKKDSEDTMILDSTYGVGLTRSEGKRHRKRTTLLKEMVAAHIAGDNIGEELRVLYVALTRAKEQLILTGTLKGLETALLRYELESEQARELYGHIAVEVVKAVNFFNYNNRERELTQLCLCGGGSAIQPLYDTIADTTGMTLHTSAELLGQRMSTQEPWTYLRAIGGVDLGIKGGLR